MSTSPVLVIGYNRPDLLFDLLGRIPMDRKVYISLDGPRTGSTSYWSDLCLVESRRFEEKHPGMVSIRFSESNQGCKLAINSAIDWAFEYEDQLIVLEDDVLPTQVFFEYMDLSLIQYKENKLVGAVNGWVPFQNNEAKNETFFSIYFQPWGWGTWKDRWKKNDRDLVTFNSRDFQNFKSWSIYKQPAPMHKYWEESIHKCQNGYDTWDTQWQYSIWLNEWIVLCPPEKLTGNVGFDWRATHTTAVSGRGQTQLPRNGISISQNTSLKPAVDPFLTRLHGIQSFEYDTKIELFFAHTVIKFIKTLLPNQFKRRIASLLRF